MNRVMTSTAVTSHSGLVHQLYSPDYLSIIISGEPQIRYQIDGSVSVSFIYGVYSSTWSLKYSDVPIAKVCPRKRTTTDASKTVLWITDITGIEVDMCEKS